MLPVVTVIGIEAAFLMGGLIVTETVFNIPGRRALPGRGDPLARLSDRAEPGDVHRGGRGVDQFPGRPALRGARSAHQVFLKAQRMASIDIAPVPAPDTARAEGVWSKIRYHAASHPLGVVGAVIMAVFVFAAIFRRFHHVVRPDQDQFGDHAAAAESRALARRRLDGPRHLQPHRLRRAHFARGRHRLDRPRLPSFGVTLGLASGYLGGWVDLVDPAHRRRAAVGAAAGAGAGDGGGARARARQHHHRDRDPAGPLYRARHPLQHADAARAAVRRSRARRRHERIPHRRAPRAAQHAGAADRASRPRSSARRS